MQHRSPAQFRSLHSPCLVYITSPTLSLPSHTNHPHLLPTNHTLFHPTPHLLYLVLPHPTLHHTHPLPSTLLLPHHTDHSHCWLSRAPWLCSKREMAGLSHMTARSSGLKPSSLRPLRSPASSNSSRLCTFVRSWFKMARYRDSRVSQTPAWLFFFWERFSPFNRLAERKHM